MAKKETSFDLGSFSDYINNRNTETDNGHPRLRRRPLGHTVNPVRTLTYEGNLDYSREMFDNHASIPDELRHFSSTLGCGVTAKIQFETEHGLVLKNGNYSYNHQNPNGAAPLTFKTAGFDAYQLRHLVAQHAKGDDIASYGSVLEAAAILHNKEVVDVINTAFADVLNTGDK